MVLNISARRALNYMLVLLLLVVLFHILVLVEIIPYTIVWAGRLKDAGQMRQFETISIAINLLLIGTLLCYAQYIRNNISPRLLRAVIWIFFILFSLNTIGNLFAEISLERYLFGALTLLSALLCFLILNGRNTTKTP